MKSDKWKTKTNEKVPKNNWNIKLTTKYKLESNILREKTRNTNKNRQDNQTRLLWNLENSLVSRWRFPTRNQRKGNQEYCYGQKIVWFLAEDVQRETKNRWNLESHHIKKLWYWFRITTTITQNPQLQSMNNGRKDCRCGTSLQRDSSYSSGCTREALMDWRKQSYQLGRNGINANQWRAMDCGAVASLRAANTLEV